LLAEISSHTSPRANIQDLPRGPGRIPKPFPELSVDKSAGDFVLRVLRLDSVETLDSVTGPRVQVPFEKKGVTAMAAAIKLGEMRDARYEVDKAQIKLDAAKALLALLEARTAAAPVTVTTTAEAPTAAAAHTELEAFFDEIPVMPAAAEAEAKKTRDLREEPEIPYDAPGPEVPRNGRFLPAGAIAAANAAETFSELDAFFDSIPKMPSHEEAMQWGHDKHQRDLGHWARNWAAKDDAGRKERFESMRRILKDLKPDALQKFLAELPAKQLEECRRLHQLTTWDLYWAEKDAATAAADN
jgi:hypothetical protein